MRNALALLCLLGLFTDQCYAASSVSVDTGSAYAATVLERLHRIWKPHASEQHAATLLVLLDPVGHVAQCSSAKPPESSFAKEMCALVRKAAPFGKTGYSVPIKLYLSLRTDPAPRHETERNPSPEPATPPKASVQPKTQAPAKDAVQPKAQAPAKDPVQQAVVPPKSVEPQPVSEKAKVKEAPALPTYGETIPPVAVLPLPKDQQEPRKKSQSERVKKYVELLQFYLNRVLVLPESAPRAHYTMTMEVVVDANGKILSVGTITTSGNNAVDASMKRSVLAARTVPKPPQGIGSVFAVPLAATM